MNEPDPRKSESEHNPDNWKSWPPEIFISAMLQELRDPLQVIKGYMGILSNEAAKEYHPKAIKSINFSIERIEKLYEDVSTYLCELRRKSDK